MKSKLNVCIIGSGNVASHLAINLQNAGCAVGAIFSRNILNAKKLAQRIKCPLATDKIREIPPSSLYILAVKDSALEKLAEDLSSSGMAKNAIVAHTAGSIPISVLSQRFSKAAVIYPMQTISKNRNINFKDVPLFIEASDVCVLKTIVEICKMISCHVSILNSEKRRKLHLSAVFACNFVNHCYALAFKLLNDVSIPPEYLLPLIDETAKKIHYMTPSEAQTGPAVRWDENVMTEQFKILYDYPEMQEVYKIMSQGIHKLTNKS